MANILLFHHVQGLTSGVIAFADELRAAGHQVTTPDLFDGQTFPSIAAGLEHAKSVGFGAIQGAALNVAEGMPHDLVYGGFSMGVMPAQRLAQQRPGACGALFYHGALDVTEFGEAWPEGLPVQIHAAEDDPEFNNGWDLPAAQTLVAQAGNHGRLFLYPGDAHLFTDRSLGEYDPAATELVLQRTLKFLAALG